MKIAFHPPSPALQPYVVGYLEVTAHFDSPFENAYIPRGVPALIITGPDYGIQDNYLLGQNFVFKAEALYFFGQTTYAVKSLSHGNCSCLMIPLHPAVAGLFFRDDALLFTNELYDITDFNGDTRSLISQLNDTSDSAARVQLIERFLLRRLGDSAPPRLVEGAVSLLMSAPGKLSIRELGELCHTSERSLRRSFSQHVGISAKQMNSIVRFRRTIRDLVAHPEQDILEVAYRYGFYDYSHLIKDFYKFTGESPERYLARHTSVDQHFLPKLG